MKRKTITLSLEDKRNAAFREYAKKKGQSLSSLAEDIVDGVLLLRNEARVDIRNAAKACLDNLYNQLAGKSEEERTRILEDARRLERLVSLLS